MELEDCLTVLDMMKAELDGKVTKVGVGGKVEEEKVILEDVKVKVLKCEEKKVGILKRRK